MKDRIVMGSSLSASKHADSDTDEDEFDDSPDETDEFE